MSHSNPSTVIGAKSQSVSLGPSVADLVDTKHLLNRLENVSDVVDAEIVRDHRPYDRCPKLTVVIPAFNEAKTIENVIQKVRRLDIDKQIIIVDDGSTDGTREILLAMQDLPDVEVFFHVENQGKGAALQTGFRLAEGEIVIVQDADLEYDPEDILRVIEPIVQGTSSIAYGSRYLQNNHQNSSYFHRFGNWMLTTFSNCMNGQQLTDMETCYKAFRRDILQKIVIEQRRFGFEPEITAKIARMGIAIPEVPIRYNARSWTEGKKIGIRDLISTLYCIVRYRCFA